MKILRRLLTNFNNIDDNSIFSLAKIVTKAINPFTILNILSSNPKKLGLLRMILNSINSSQRLKCQHEINLIYSKERMKSDNKTRGNFIIGITYILLIICFYIILFHNRNIAAEVRNIIYFTIAILLSSIKDIVIKEFGSTTHYH